MGLGESLSKRVSAWGGEKEKTRGCILFGTRAFSSVTVSGVAATEEQLLREENTHLRQQAHYYQSLHARAVAKLQDWEGMNAALKEKTAELTRRLFGRKSEKSANDKATNLANSGPTGSKKRLRGQQAAVELG